MMGAVQAVHLRRDSKTVNVPKEATVDEIMQAYLEAWRPGGEGDFHLSGREQAERSRQHVEDKAASPEAVAQPKPVRRKLPDERQGHHAQVRIAGTRATSRSPVQGRHPLARSSWSWPRRDHDFRVRRCVRPGILVRAPVRGSASHVLVDKSATCVSSRPPDEEPRTCVTGQVDRPITSSDWLATKSCRPRR